MSNLRVEEIVEALTNAMPSLDATEQRIAVAVYETLAEGDVAEPAQLARRTGVDEALIREKLDAWPGIFRDEAGRIVGFWGLAIPEMPHRFEVDGVGIYTWCAYDPLFIAPLLGRDARVDSKDPASGETVTLTVTSEGVEAVSPSAAVVSFLIPTEAWGQDVIQTFCHYVHFFASRQSGDRWVNDNPGTLLVSIDEAFEIGRRVNAATFGDVLGRRNEIRRAAAGAGARS